MTSDTHGKTRNLMAGLVGQRTGAISPSLRHKMDDPLGRILHGAKSSTRLRQKKRPVSLAKTPFDWRDEK